MRQVPEFMEEMLKDNVRNLKRDQGNYKIICVIKSLQYLGFYSQPVNESFFSTCQRRQLFEQTFGCSNASGKSIRTWIELALGRALEESDMDQIGHMVS